MSLLLLDFNIETQCFVLVKKGNIMKEKIGTILDENLVKLARQIALAQNLTISQLIEEALMKYLRGLKEENTRTNIAYQTKGAMRVPPDLLKSVMDEDSYYEV